MWWSAGWSSNSGIKDHRSNEDKSSRSPAVADFDWPYLAGYGYGLGIRVMMDQ